MKLLKTLIFIFLHVNYLRSAQADENCHVDDVDCQFQGESFTFNMKNAGKFKDLESLSWTELVQEQFDKLKETLFGPPEPAPVENSPPQNGGFSEEDFMNALNIDEASMMQYASQLASSFLEDDQLDVFNEFAGGVFQSNADTVIGDKSNFMYPPVERIKPHSVGHVQYRELEEGVQTKLITRAVSPPLFEIPNFLSPEHCDEIIKQSDKKGMFESTMFQSADRTDNKENIGIERVSYSQFISGKDLDRDLLNQLHKKLAKLLDVPLEVIQWSEHLSIGMYKPRGHYYAHYDASEEGNKTKPCCFQTTCSNTKDNAPNSECCRMCRYATVLYYLNDVEEGGETAFPNADLSLKEITAKSDKDFKNLTEYCHDASVVIKPEKGKAILWFNHFIDRNGYIDSIDRRSIHGGCDVIKGEKWIATNWISTPTYPYRYGESIYRKMFYENMGIEDPNPSPPLENADDTNNESVDKDDANPNTSASD